MCQICAKLCSGRGRLGPVGTDRSLDTEPFLEPVCPVLTGQDRLGQSSPGLPYTLEIRGHYLPTLQLNPDPVLGGGRVWQAAMSLSQ